MTDKPSLIIQLQFKRYLDEWAVDESFVEQRYSTAEMLQIFPLVKTPISGSERLVVDRAALEQAVYAAGLALQINTAEKMVTEYVVCRQ